MFLPQCERPNTVFWLEMTYAVSLQKSLHAPHSRLYESCQSQETLRWQRHPVAAFEEFLWISMHNFSLSFCLWGGSPTSGPWQWYHQASSNSCPTGGEVLTLKVRGVQYFRCCSSNWPGRRPTLVFIWLFYDTVSHTAVTIQWMVLLFIYHKTGKKLGISAGKKHKV
jgi:hypothetical protein